MYDSSVWYLTNKFEIGYFDCCDSSIYLLRKEWSIFLLWRNSWKQTSAPWRPALTPLTVWRTFWPRYRKQWMTYRSVSTRICPTGCLNWMKKWRRNWEPGMSWFNYLFNSNIYHVGNFIFRKNQKMRQKKISCCISNKQIVLPST